jgi:biopolymer transport protein ExbD
MTKADKSSMTNTTMFLAIVVVVLAGLLLYSKSTRQSISVSPPAQAEEVKKPSDLDAAQDQLNYVNIDGVDVGLNQLNSEVSTY